MEAGRDPAHKAHAPGIIHDVVAAADLTPDPQPAPRSRLSADELSEYLADLGANAEVIVVRYEQRPSPAGRRLEAEYE